MPAARPSPPRICIVSPAGPAANNGNWHTASRWQRFLEPVAEVEIRAPYDEAIDGDLLIALHARRSAEAIVRWRARRPNAPVVLVLTGTDLYRDLEGGDVDALHSLQCASRVVVLQEAALGRLDGAARAKAVVIVQSAAALVIARTPGDADFVAVGHLRAEKDPQTLMAAARLLRADGGAGAPTIAHVGDALDAAMGAAARATMAACPAYRWLGPLSHAAARRTIARARALVHPSRMEGGANVVVEAVRSRVPVLASRIDGNVGLLGRDYDGTFPAGDAAALAALMRRFLRDADFAAHLAAQCALREPLFRPAAERRAVRAVVDGLMTAKSAPR